MKHDINFWPPPDWSRESSLSPDFLMAVMVAIAIVLSFLFYTLAENRRRQTESERLHIEVQVQNMAPQVERLTAMERESKQWGAMLDKLAERAEARIFWSRQLEALQKLTPPDIVLSSISVRDESIPIEVEPPPEARQRGRRPTPSFRYETGYSLEITAIYIGDSIEHEKSISAFADRIGNSQAVGRYLDSYGTRNIRDLAGTESELFPGGKSFVFTCTYQAIPDIM